MLLKTVYQWDIRNQENLNIFTDSPILIMRRENHTGRCPGESTTMLTIPPPA